MTKQEKVIEKLKKIITNFKVIKHTNDNGIINTAWMKITHLESELADLQKLPDEIPSDEDIANAAAIYEQDYQKSLCETCQNKLHVKYLELPFRFNKFTGEQTIGNEIKEYNSLCIYFNSNRESSLNSMIIVECNQHKPNGGK